MSVEDVWYIFLEGEPKYKDGKMSTPKDLLWHGIDPKEANKQFQMFKCNPLISGGDKESSI